MFAEPYWPVGTRASAPRSMCGHEALSFGSDCQVERLCEECGCPIGRGHGIGRDQTPLHRPVESAGLVRTNQRDVTAPAHLFLAGLVLGYLCYTPRAHLASGHLSHGFLARRWIRGRSFCVA